MRKNLLKGLIIAAFCFSIVTSVSAQCAVEAYFSPYDNVETVVVDNLSKAKTSIHCSLYGITNLKITDTLKSQAKQGLMSSYVWTRLSGGTDGM
jgi:hypothetical protein